MNTNEKFAELNEQEKINFFIEKLDEFMEANEGIKLINTKIEEEICLERRIGLMNQKTVIHNMLIDIIYMSVEVLPPQESCAFIGIEMSDYQKIDFNLKLPIIRLGTYFKRDLRAYQKMQDACHDFYRNKLSKNRSGSIFKAEHEKITLKLLLS